MKKKGTCFCLVTSGILTLLGIVIPFIGSPFSQGIIDIFSTLYAGILATIVVWYFVQSIKELLKKGQMSFNICHIVTLIILFIPILFSACHSCPFINTVLMKVPTACFSALFVYLWELLSKKSRNH